MQAFFSQYGFIGFIGMAIFGILAFYGLFDRRQRTVRKEGLEAEDRARKLLREEVTVTPNASTYNVRIIR